MLRGHATCTYSNIIDLFTANGNIHYSKSACLNLQTIALTYQNNNHGYISNLLKRLVIQYVLVVAIGPVYGLVLSQSRSLCDALRHTMLMFKKKPSLCLFLRVLLLRNILISAVIKPMKSVQKFMPR